VFDILGQAVRVLADEVQSPGAHVAVWDGRDDAGRALATGVYVCQLQVGKGLRMTRKLVLVR